MKHLGLNYFNLSENFYKVKSQKASCLDPASFFPKCLLHQCAHLSISYPRGKLCISRILEEKHLVIRLTPKRICTWIYNITKSKTEISKETGYRYLNRERLPALTQCSKFGLTWNCYTYRQLKTKATRRRYEFFGRQKENCGGNCLKLLLVHSICLLWCVCGSAR